MDEARAHLVFLRSGGLVIVKRPAADDWRELQDQYADYMASLGPWAAQEIVDYFSLDYGEGDDGRWPVSREAIVAFMQSAESSLRVP